MNSPTGRYESSPLPGSQLGDPKMADPVMRENSESARKEQQRGGAAQTEDDPVAIIGRKPTRRAQEGFS